MIPDLKIYNGRKVEKTYHVEEIDLLFGVVDDNGIVPDRRQKEPEKSWVEDYITPLHKHKQELEEKVKHKQAELDAAKQELRDFTATLRQLMEDTT